MTVPLALVTGFLGSGKTTYLRRVVEANRARKVVYLINEFSPRDVDGQLLPLGPEVVSVPGGSIFCKCLVTQFIGRLREIAEKWHRPDSPVVGVVVEASGMANPRVAAKMLAETGLDQIYHLSRVVAVLDPGTFLKLRRTLPAIREQIAAADVGIVNKADLHPAEQLAAVEAAAREMHPGLELVRAERCAVDLDLFGENRPRELAGEYAKCVDPDYAKFDFEPAGRLEIARLEAALAAAGEAVYRLKGFAPTAAGWVYYDYSAGRLTAQPQPASANPTPGLALIVRGADRAAGEALVAALGEK